MRATPLMMAAMLLAGVASTARGSTAVLVASAPSGPAGLWLAARGGGATDAHFAAANTTRDGRLTWQQAREADWPQVADHFAVIDSAGRGWVTLAQVHAFLRAEHSHRRSG